jgi:hypothetical protein
MTNVVRDTITRRAVIRAGLAAGAFLPVAGLFSGAARAAGLPALDPADPMAKSLGFVTDTTKVDATTNPTHQASQKCGLCAQFQGKPGDATGGCNIFAGKSVPQNGWCKVWAQKPS